jgi:hypothetical protein
MKTTVELPDELVKAIKRRAVEEERPMKDLVTELLRRGLKACDEPSRPPRRMRFPLIRGTAPAKSDEEVTPARMKEILNEDDVRRALR